MKTHDEFVKNLRERYEAGITDTPDPWDELTEMEIYDGHNAPYWVYTKESVERARAAVEAAHKAEIATWRDEVEHWVKRYNELEQWRVQQSVTIVRLTQERDCAVQLNASALAAAEDLQRLRVQAEAERNALKAWKDAMVNLAVVDGIYTVAHENDPRQCLMDIMQWEQQIALDPAVSADASALRDTFKQERDALAAQVATLREIALDALAVWQGEDESEPSYSPQKVTRSLHARVTLRQRIAAATEGGTK